MCYKKGEKNIFGTELVHCSINPITGFYRDGFCHTDKLDRGLHVVCSLINDEFLDFSKKCTVTGIKKRFCFICSIFMSFSPMELIFIG